MSHLASVRDRVVATCPICLHTMALGDLFTHIVVTGHTREVKERLRMEGLDG